MLSPSERSEYMAALDDAWSGTSSASMAGNLLRIAVEDAIQAQRPWARIVADEAADAGFVMLAKRHRRRTVRTRRGSVAAVHGVIDGLGWVQLSFETMTPDQVRQALKVRRDQRASASRNIRALRAILEVCKRHPSSSTVGDALRLEGVSLGDVLGQVA